MKDHEIAAIVNELRDIAVQYHGSGQLRERIAHAIVPVLKSLNPVQPSTLAQQVASALPSSVMDRIAKMDKENVVFTDQYAALIDPEVPPRDRSDSLDGVNILAMSQPERIAYAEKLSRKLGSVQDAIHPSDILMTRISKMNFDPKGGA